jgi:hypothetical protein
MDLSALSRAPARLGRFGAPFAEEMRPFRGAKRIVSHAMGKVSVIIMTRESTISPKCLFSMPYAPFRFAVFHHGRRLAKSAGSARQAVPFSKTIA